MPISHRTWQVSYLSLTHTHTLSLYFAAWQFFLDLPPYSSHCSSSSGPTHYHVHLASTLSEDLGSCTYMYKEKGEEKGRTEEEK